MKKKILRKKRQACVKAVVRQAVVRHRRRVKAPKQTSHRRRPVVAKTAHRRTATLKAVRPKNHSARELVERPAPRHLPVPAPVVEPVREKQEPATAELEELAAEIEAVEPTPRQEEHAAAEPSNAYSLYLREIGKTKLLTPQDEVRLAGRIQRGDGQAREEMIKANLRLVVKIAREYEDYGVPLLDLINEGNIGLMKAVERFDPTKGAKLSTYAAWWIKQAIRRALSNQSKTIRLPVHVGDKLVHLRRASMKLQEQLGRDPTDEELAHALGTTPLRVAELRSAGTRPSSLDAPIGGEDDSNAFADIIGDEKADTPYQELEEKTNTEMIRELVKQLPEREAVILRYRFGLDGDEEKTLEEVGQKFGVTRERIRQLQNIALNRLRKMIQKREAVKMVAA